ncbi:Proteasome assembly chaperone 2 [Frankliniella fusca]|uniref:Proteasome assembly chaperone 2 n=1 Tax=Frankliniella fusca TaxID=407009 RepID=A0AAE1GV61_9NEOP|nr:Proteasome assembly chaperone 2 [Frankliniella fusca]
METKTNSPAALSVFVVVIISVIMTDTIEETPQLYYPITDVNFDGCTLIVPSVSVGNVGQLCTDLLILSLGCQKTGYLWHQAILPIVGADPYKVSSPDLALPAEVYYSKNHNLVILQLRSSIIKKLRKRFLSDLVLWMKSIGVSQVTVLTGSSNEERIDEQITTEPFRYLVSAESNPSLAETFRSLGWISLEKRLHFPALSKLESLEEDNQNGGQIVIPGGGFAKQLITVCTESNLNCVALIKFCSEGDNIPDALVMLRKLNEWLKLLEVDSMGSPKLVFPHSWNHLFGNPPPRQLY